MYIFVYYALPYVGYVEDPDESSAGPWGGRCAQGTATACEKPEEVGVYREPRVAGMTYCPLGFFQFRTPALSLPQPADERESRIHIAERTGLVA